MSFQASTENTAGPSGPVSREASRPPSAGLYQTVWRWHFYAGLFVIPFTLLLAITGSIYLFKPYVEPRLYRHLHQVPIGAEARLPSELIRAAEAVHPGAKALRYAPPAEPGRTATVQLAGGGWEKTDVFVDPSTAAVVGSLERDAMLMQRVRKLHGELLMGAFGTKLVELAGCWTFILLLTGLFLWWPRQARFSPWGLLLPRLGSGGRVFWRDLHAVGGFYIALLVMALLVTGLPWTDVWGGLFKEAQKRTGQAAPPGQFFNPYKSQAAAEGAKAMPIGVEEVLRLSHASGIHGEFEVEMPKGPTGTYAIHTEGGHHGSGDPAMARMIHVDQYSGKIVKETGWKDYPATAKAVRIGVRLHQGEYFGLPNLLLALLAALGVVLLSVSGAMMWWKRRPPGGLGAPRVPEGFRNPKAFIALTLILAVFFPLVGASLVLVWILEKTLFRARPSPASAAV